MSILTSVCIIAYTILGFITHVGIQKEWRNDTSKELDDFSPTFIQISLVTVALCWPILICVATYQVIKGRHRGNK